MTPSGRLVVEQITAGVDWLTVTRHIQPDQDMPWFMRGVDQVYRIGNLGYDVKPRTMLGYDGISAGNCFAGQRDDGVMMQFSGFHADEAFPLVYHEEANISRIDLQITVKFNVMPRNVAKEAYTRASDTNGGLPVHRRRKLYIIMGSDGGDTFYCGSPSSDQRGRLYNKEVQSEDILYTRCWRYEVVYRNDRAKVVAAHIASSTSDRATTVRDIASNWWESRGIDCTYISTGARNVIPLLRTLPTDIERKLKWIRTQVRPTLKALIEAGMFDELQEAIGLMIVNPTQTTKEEAK